MEGDRSECGRISRHPPSLQLLLLAEGHTLYYGDAHVCPQWFERVGQPVPFGEKEDEI